MTVAGVTIVTLAGDNGLLIKASGAKDASTEGETLEKIKLAYEDYYLGQYTQTENTFQNALDKMFGTGVATVSGPDSKGVFTVSVNEKTYEFNSVTGIAREKPDISISKLITTDNYGEYIDLGQDVVGKEETTDDWRILYNDKNNNYGGSDGARIYAILADYLPNSNAAVANAGLSRNTSLKYNAYSSISAQDLLSRLENEEAWKTLISTGLQNKGAKVRGATTVEILMASYNEKYGTNLNCTNSHFLRTNPSDNTSSIDTLYMPHPGNGYEGCFGYWLDSIYASDTRKIWRVISSGRVQSNLYTFTDGGVCPVVSLPSNLEVTKNGTVWTVIMPQ